jgi:hypothetical protein
MKKWPLWVRILVWGFIVYCIFAVIVGIFLGVTGKHIHLDTDTPVTPTPTPIPSVKDQITNAVQNTGEVLYGDLKRVTYSNGKTTVTYYIPANRIWDHENARSQIKINSFFAERAIWQNVKQVTEVAIVVQGDLTDSYGNKSIGDLGRVDLTQATEKKFNWDGLGFDSAWQVYDSAWFLPDLLT